MNERDNQAFLSGILAVAILLAGAFLLWRFVGLLLHHWISALLVLVVIAIGASVVFVRESRN